MDTGVGPQPHSTVYLSPWYDCAIQSWYPPSSPPQPTQYSHFQDQLYRMPAMVVPALAMSVTKDDLFKRLDMSGETYNLMAKETDRVYKWLTADEHNLKGNCKLSPPYDWSDITEKAKHEAMTLLAQSGDSNTSEFWKQGTTNESSAKDCPNWIARWFLYHKFRYRDGRNKTREGDRVHSSRHHGRSRRNSQVQAMSSSPSEQGRAYNLSSYDDFEETSPQGLDDYQYQPSPSVIVGPAYASATCDASSYDAPRPGDFYDPVKGWTKK